MPNDSLFDKVDNILNKDRLNKLRSVNLLDTVPETSFDRITQLASDVLGVPVSLVSLIDINRQFFKSQIGLSEPTASKRETPLSHSFCKHVVQNEKNLIVEDARKDEHLMHNLAIRDLNVIAYAGVPITLSDGHTLGAFCAIDSEPRQWTERDISILNNLAQWVITEIELRAELLKQQAETTLEANKAMFQKITETANDSIIVLNEDAEIIFSNPMTSNIFGYSKEQLNGKTVDDLTSVDTPSTFQQLSLGIFTSKNTKSAWQSIRLTGQHKDGHDIPIEVSLSHFTVDDDEQFFTLIIRDVHSQVDIENELRASEERYLQILDAIPDIVFVKDENLRLVWANKALQNYYGMSLDEIIGILDAEHVEATLTENYNEIDATVFREGKVIVIPEEPIVRHDGTIRQFTTTKTPLLDTSGEVMLLVGISRDITDSRNLERYLTEALEKNHELIELKSGFTSMVSHEFRTPLAVIMTSTEILINYFERLSQNRRYEKLETIREQVKRLTHLMDSVLVVSKGDAQGLPFKPSLHNVQVLAYNIIEEVKMGYNASNVSVDYVYQGSHEHQHIDADLFRHIFQNLLTNAVKYSKSGTEVQARINASDDHITIVIVDQGIGIPKENQENMFNTFHRANNVGTIQGTGLGLAIVKRAVDTHGGTINFKSVENQGTMFVVTLPTS
ncbi:MAG: hypothetical protein Phog2KO_38640 [Phototrophicaceae bacterium]